MINLDSDNRLAEDTGNTLFLSPHEAAKFGFDSLPSDKIVRAFGVEYAHLSLPKGGDIYLTRFGWPWLEQLLPDNWYTDKWYARQGEKLPCSTGSVFHVRSKEVKGRSADLVVKFSRVAQEVPLVVATTFPDDVPPEIIATARFNSPMEEFGLVMELRRGDFGPKNIRFRTQIPLGIYAPPEEFQLWQLGRDTSRFHTHRRLLADNQESLVKAIELDIKRIYVMLYGWIKGRDAEDSFNDGVISEKQFKDLTPRVIAELSQKGFRVLDNKPKHFILRARRKDNSVLRRDKKNLTYALVDFELLQRTAEYQKIYKRNRREWYRRFLVRSTSNPASQIPSNLGLVNIFGIDYVFGRTTDGGLLWVVGKNCDLFDYFIPDRWRRTARIKLSSQNEVYRTRTRDNINVVYRRSRVGSFPRIDPLSEEGKRIREHGYNSPFEEIVLAERLRQMGIPTTFPRAIYRTGHRSTKARYLRDSRRIDDHSSIVTPDNSNESILDADYDYYTIWDDFHGFGPDSRTKSTFNIGLEEALESELIKSEEVADIQARVQRMLGESQLEDERVEDYSFSVFLDEDGSVCRDKNGDLFTTFGIDALTAFEIGLIGEKAYGTTIKQLEMRLRSADCEKLDLKGSHALLSMNPDGRFSKNRDGGLRMALCNFEFIRGLYRPIR